MLDIGATLVTAHSEKEEAAGNWKGGFGFHPLLCFLDETDEGLAGLLRPGNAGSNTATDHEHVLIEALEQLPQEVLDEEILVRCDVGGATHDFTQTCRDADIRFSVGYELTEAVREAVLALPETAWQAAIDREGEERDGAWVTELTAGLELAAWPEGTRLIVRRERPHPGAQLTFSDQDGHRFTCFLTDQRDEDLAALELRHRRRARVEDRIRCAKDTGLGNLPFHAFAHNRVWLELALIAQDLLAWAQALTLTVNSASPSPSACATACSTPPAGSCAPVAAPGCASLATGHGPRRSPRRFAACARFRSVPRRDRRLARGPNQAGVHTAKSAVNRPLLVAGPDRGHSSQSLLMHRRLCGHTHLD